MYFLVRSRKSSYPKCGVPPTTSVILRRPRRETNNEKDCPVPHYSLRGIPARETPRTALRYRNDNESRRWRIGERASSLIQSLVYLLIPCAPPSSANAQYKSIPETNANSSTTTKNLDYLELTAVDLVTYDVQKDAKLRGCYRGT